MLSKRYISETTNHQLKLFRIYNTQNITVLMV